MIEKLKNLLLKQGKLSDFISDSELNNEKEPHFYYVVEGMVDLFLTQESNEHKTGALMFFASFPSHALLPSKPALKEHESWYLQAKLSPGTKLIKLSYVAIEKWMQSVEFNKEMEGLIEFWINALFKSINPLLKPPNLEYLNKNQSLALKPQTAFINKTDSILWIKTKEPVSLLGNSITQPLFPLVQQAWIASNTSVAIKTLSTKTIIKEDKFFDCLQSFYQTLLQLGIQTIIKCEAIEEKQFQLGIEERGQRLDSALEALGNFYSETEVSAVTFKEGQHSARLVIELVANTLGIKVDSPKELPNYTDKILVNLILDNFQISRREVALTDQWWETAHGALIGFLEESQEAVALLYDKKTGYQLVRPATGEKVIVDETIAQTLSPFAISLYRSLPMEAMSFKDVVYWSLKYHKNEFKLVILISIFTGLLSLFTPWATGQLFSVVIPDASYSLLTQLIIGFLSASVGIVCFEIARRYTLWRINGFITNAGSAGIWDRITKLPLSFFKNYSSGDLLDRALGFQTLVSQTFSVTVNSIFDSIYGLFYFALLFYYSLSLSFVALGLLLCIGSLTFVFLNNVVKIQRVTSDLNGQLASLLTEYISGIQKIKTTASESYVFNNWSNLFLNFRKSHFRSQLWSSVLIAFNSLLPILTTIIIFIVAASLITSNKLGLGGFIAFNAAFGSLLGITLKLTGTLNTILQMIPTFERVKPILDTFPEVYGAKNDPGSITGAIEVDHLYFRYSQTGPYVLQDVSFSLSPGEFVAIVGPSGSGKSTLLRLLMQFETPTGGSIFFDNKSMEYLDINKLRRQIGVVLQHSSLFPGSIFENIIGSAPLTLDDAWLAAKHAGFDKDIALMPMGMHTLISEGSGGLSGGQKQRLLIARALVNRPKLLFFDEATSALDNETQQIVTESLNQLNATRLVIAHRLSTIIKADKIIVLVDGKVEEVGDYNTLMDKKGAFYKIASRQLA